LAITKTFFPHGLGHFLGIQVHDVAGNESYEGDVVASSAEYPRLRMTRMVEPDQVFTIEPGVYFIEMLLRQHHSGEHREKINWQLVDRLIPFGGVRIEDDIL